MESVNILDITIKYFNVIVFVLCVFFGMSSFFVSWVLWRELNRKRNILRSVVAAYNIAEDTLERGRTHTGDLDLDPAIVQTVFNSLQEILNAIHGEITGKPMPARDDRSHGSRLLAGVARVTGRFRRSPEPEEAAMCVEERVPPFVPEHRHHEGAGSHP